MEFEAFDHQRAPDSTIRQYSFFSVLIPTSDSENETLFYSKILILRKANLKLIRYILRPLAEMMQMHGNMGCDFRLLQ